MATPAVDLPTAAHEDARMNTAPPPIPRLDSLLLHKHEQQPRIARITLNRPQRLNAIGAGMPADIRAAVRWAEQDDEIHVIVLEGAGRAFCAGYDMQDFGSGRTDHPCQQESQPWDPMLDYAAMKGYTEDFMSLWRCSKPTIAKVHGFALAGGSDIALCCDLLLMAEDAKIGYMPTRVWGCPTTAMWTYRIGAARAKQLMFTGDTIDGCTAAAWGLANAAVPAEQLEAATLQLAQRIAGVPRSQLAMHKLVVNQAMLSMGLEQTQMFATLFDGITRHNPEGMWFRRQAQAEGFKSAVQWRDSGRNIPEADEARALIRQLEQKLRDIDAARAQP
jgi:enoyl-CoA hydratase